MPARPLQIRRPLNQQQVKLTPRVVESFKKHFPNVEVFDYENLANKKTSLGEVMSDVEEEALRDALRIVSHAGYKPPRVVIDTGTDRMGVTYPNYRESRFGIQGIIDPEARGAITLGHEAAHHTARTRPGLVDILGSRFKKVLSDWNQSGGPSHYRGMISHDMSPEEMFADIVGMMSGEAISQQGRSIPLLPLADMEKLATIQALRHRMFLQDVSKLPPQEVELGGDISWPAIQPNLPGISRFPTESVMESWEPRIVTIPKRKL